MICKCQLLCNVLWKVKQSYSCLLVFVFDIMNLVQLLFHFIFLNYFILSCISCLWGMWYMDVSIILSSYRNVWVWGMLRVCVWGRWVCGDVCGSWVVHVTWWECVCVCVHMRVISIYDFHNMIVSIDQSYRSFIYQYIPT